MFIELKNNKMKCVSAKKSGGKYHLNQYAELCIDFETADEAELISALRTLNQWNDKKVNLVVNNNQIFYRELKLPMIKNTKKLESIFKQEIGNALSSVDRLISDYIVLSENNEDKIARVLGSAIEMKTIDRYLEIFAKSGYKLVKINAANNTLIQYVMNMKIEEDCFVVVDINQDQLKLFLFDSKEFVIVRSSRVLGEVTSQSLLEELSKMQQFQHSRNKNSTIAKVFYYSELETTTELIRQVRENLLLPIEALGAHYKIVSSDNCDYQKCISILGLMVGE